jgi:hypothetical protein
MRKELFFAIGAGLILGLIIAFGIWRVNKTITPSDNNKTETSESSPTPNAGFSITIANAENFDVVTDSPFKITGLTKPNIKVAISGEEKDYIFDSKNDGSFEKDISLIAGLNEIVINAFDLNGESVQKKLVLIYSSEFKKYIQTNEEEKTATDEADSVRLKVEEKIATAMKSPKAYVGTITDVSSTTFQIKNTEGAIEQISFSKETDFIKIDKTAKTITSNDVAIGDSIIAMGLKNGNEVLEAKRILVAEIASDIQREIFMAKVNSIKTKEINLTNLGNQEQMVFTLDTDTDLILIKDLKSSTLKISDIEQDQIVYAFIVKSSKSSLARTIYIIENTETPSPTPTPKASTIASPKVSSSPSSVPSGER